MSRIGKIDLVPQGDRQILKGEFVTAHHAVEFLLTRSQERRSDKAPTHEIITRGGHGRFATIGSAWEHTITRGENAGAVMYTLRFDDPDLPNLQLTAFPSMVSNEHNLNRWDIETERERKPAQNGPGQAAPSAPEDLPEMRG